MHKNKLQIFSCLSFGLLSVILPAQDIHFSQADLNPIGIGPAALGIYKEDWRAALQYRSQWESVPVQYRTLMANYDTKLWSSGKNALSAGAVLAQDQAGDAVLRWTQLGLRTSVAHALGQSQKLAVGFGLDMVQRNIDPSRLTFKNQWNGDNFDPSLPTNEALKNSSGVKASLHAGLGWQFAKNTTRTQVDAGAGIAHLNRPEIHFKTNDPYKLPIRWNLYAFSVLQNTEILDYIVFAHAQQMGTSRELVAGAGARLWLTDERAIRATLGTRVGDALIPAVHYQHRQWAVGLSYDINISDFKIATNRRGGFEMLLTYTPLKVKPLNDLKVCPIF